MPTRRRRSALTLRIISQGAWPLACLMSTLMGNTPLNPEELAAIQAAVRETRGARDRSFVPDEAEVGPLALIVDDRQAETARPNGLRIAERWARHAHKRLRQSISDDFKLAVTGAEVIDGQPTRDELSGMWFATATPADGRGSALIAIGGPIISVVTARLCGDKVGEATERAPSLTALRIFEPVGNAIAAAAAQAWGEEQACRIRIGRGPAHIDQTRRVLQDSDVVVSITLSISGAVSGHLRLLTRPVTLVPPPTPTEAVPASQAEIEAALGRVPVEVRVDLGTTMISMRELAKLELGAIVTLQNFIDDPLPVRCGDVVKAYGRPVLDRGVLSVEVDHVEQQGRTVSH